MGTVVSIVLAVIIGIELIVLEHTFFHVVYFCGCSDTIKGILAPLGTSLVLIILLQPPLVLLIIIAVVLGVVAAATNK